jgi:hypothetical protein
MYRHDNDCKSDDFKFIHGSRMDRLTKILSKISGSCILKAFIKNAIRIPVLLSLPLKQ